MKTIKRAKLGNLEAIGTTAKRAAEALDIQIQWLCANEGNTQIECRYGMVGILSPRSQGWEYTIIDGERMKKNGAIMPSCSFGDQQHLTDAMSTMRNAMAQRAWSVGVDDAAHIAESGCLDHHKRDLAYLFENYRKTASAA